MAGKIGLTPMMQQFWDIKNAHKDKVLLFRMGDFFEMFHDDAITASPIIGAALTSRNKKGGDNTPLCGVPHHSIAGPINKLLAAGYKVAICDQIEDPKQAKGIVKRAVTRILSPGMVYDPETLDSLKPNYMCSYDARAIAFLEITTGEAFYYLTDHSAIRKRLIATLSPSEMVLGEEESKKNLKSHSLDGPIITYHKINETSAELPSCAQRLLSYAAYMQGESVLKSVGSFECRELEHRLELSPLVIRHLEIFETYRGEKKGSLFHAIDRTKTSAGARLLKNWLSFPLIGKEEIEARLDGVECWLQDLPALKQVRNVLSKMGDIERRLGKISNPNCNPRDFLALASSLRAGIEVSHIAFANLKPSPERLQIANNLIESIEKQIITEPPISTKNGFFTKEGFSSQLDELILLTSNSQKCLQELEARERKQTGISSLKIRYNNVFGYYIEVTKTHQAKVPSHYVRKQTLVNAERYIIEELQELENKILSAKSKKSDLEFQYFEELKKHILCYIPELLLLTRRWSELDVLSSSAWLAVEHDYCRPSFVSDRSLSLKSSRHPVVEQMVRKSFVANDISLDPHHCLLLTGPNMAGKSTLMRQVAVIGLMAQTGLFVPAKEARLPLFDCIFTRIGSSDFLAEGMSTFMVEMKETAEMLDRATVKSLVVLDEVGRGTSTYDGMSLAQAILEYLMGQCRAMTLFATHYHELTKLADLFPQVRNKHMSITEDKGQIHFLYTLSKGPANKSYGIQVGQLAGLPSLVTKRAKTILHQLEGHQEQNQMELSSDLETTDYIDVESLSSEHKELLKAIKDMSLQSITPLEAINKIAQWQKTLS